MPLGAITIQLINTMLRSTPILWATDNYSLTTKGGTNSKPLSQVRIRGATIRTLGARRTFISHCLGRRFLPGWLPKCIFPVIPYSRTTRFLTVFATKQLANDSSRNLVGTLLFPNRRLGSRSTLFYAGAWKPRWRTDCDRFPKNRCPSRVGSVSNRRAVFSNWIRRALSE